jgi:hypothetical protein
LIEKLTKEEHKKKCFWWFYEEEKRVQARATMGYSSALPFFGFFVSLSLLTSESLFEVTDCGLVLEWQRVEEGKVRENP